MPTSARASTHAAAVALVALAAASCMPPKPPVAAPPAVVESPPPTGQLPAGVEPIGYRLELGIVPSEARFAGHAQIALRLSQSARTIWLHGQGLTVRSVKTDVAGRVVQARYAEHDDHGLARVDFPEELAAGQYVLDFAYDAPFDDGLSGLYRVTQGADTYAFTQFEAVSARKAFPCFDEPRFKVPFDVTLTVPAEDTAKF